MKAVFGRSEVVGTFGVASATHWIPAQVAMGILERGGNAFDAAVAGGLTSHVVDPHMNGLGGELVALVKRAGSALPEVVCGQGTAPARATVEAYRSRGFALIPDKGVLAAVVPGCFDAWMLMLRDYGTMEVADVIAPAIGYAAAGFPLSWEVSKFIADAAETFRTQWQSSAAIYLPGNEAPEPGAVLSNRPLAATLTRLADEARGATREARIEAARRAFYSGFVAEKVGEFVAAYRDHDGKTGETHRAFLSPEDLSAWTATIEQAVGVRYRDWQVFKAGPWAQGPVMLQILSLLNGFPISDMAALEHDFIHLVVEATKLAFADREAWYGDPRFVEVPLEHLLGGTYNAARRAAIGPSASAELCPGPVPGRYARLPAYQAGEPAKEPAATLAPASERDTCHINVIDRWRNVVAVTPSGGWIQSSPVIPTLGFSLSTRAQMFWLQEGLPASLAPDKRPRTTLSPTMALRDDGAALASGCRGADHSDQWLAQFFIHFADYRAGLQEAVDTSVFASEHWPNSAYPRNALPRRLVLDRSMTSSVAESLKAVGHDVRLAPERKLGRTCAALATSKSLRAAVTGRLPQAIAVGR